jgi:hypothetical protein
MEHFREDSGESTKIKKSTIPLQKTETLVKKSSLPKQAILKPLIPLHIMTD